MGFFNKDLTKMVNKTLPTIYDIDILEESVKHGDMDAQNKLGVMYKTGKGIKKDYTKAIVLYELSAKQGNPHAQFNLGSMYYYGNGVKVNYGTAFKYYKMSADNGYIRAQYKVGMMYRYGRGVAPEDSKAIKWLIKSVNQGNVKACHSLGTMYYFGHGDITDYSNVSLEEQIIHKYSVNKIAQYKIAHYYFLQSAKYGDTRSQVCLGIMYLHGKGVFKNKNTAREWFKKSAKLGDKTGKHNLKYMNRSWFGIKRRLNKFNKREIRLKNTMMNLRRISV
jgi:TPR repeat protein